MAPRDAKQETSLQVPSGLLTVDNSQDTDRKGATANMKDETFDEYTLTPPLKKTRTQLGNTGLIMTVSNHY